MATINIIGRGVDPAKHLTLSALKLLQSAEKVVGIESEAFFWEELHKNFGVPEVEHLGSLYSSRDKDTDNYNRFVDHVLVLSSKFSNIALLVAGHPRLGVTFIELLKKRAPAGLEINIVDGISSFAVMTTFLELDPLEQGTALLDANRLLLFQYSLEPALSYFIYHVCSVGNSTTNFLNPSENNRIDLLKKHLLKYYTHDKEVFLCKISNGKNEDSLRIRGTISELDASKIDYSTTLYLPADKPNKLDREFLNLLR